MPTSKSGSFTFAESFRREHQHTNVKTTVVCPWMVDTGMFSGANQPILPQMSIKYTVDKIMEAIEREYPYVVIPWVLYVLPLTRLVPVPIRILKQRIHYLHVHQLISLPK
jgi:short-subunit dehydrogenase